MLDNLADLTPLSISVDEEGDTYAVYQLPTPRRWPFGHGHPEGPEGAVTKVRVCISTSDFYPYHKPAASIVLFDEKGEETPMNSFVVQGKVSIAASLKRLGFQPALSLN